MIKILNGIVTNFGFTSTDDFSGSMFHPSLLIITLPLAVVSAWIETAFGLHMLTLVAFAILLLLELVTGLAASKKKGIKIESRKFGRFGLKLTVWLSLFFIINSLKTQYKGSSVVVYEIYEWLHNGLMIYVSLEYLISVIENLGTLTGKKETGLINAIKKKVGMLDDGYNDFFNINADLLTILNREGNFIKLNDSWEEITGWTKSELLTSQVISFIHPEDVKKSKEENIKLLNTSSYKSVNFINRFRTKSGEYLTLSWSSKAGSGGNIYSTVRIID